jgi:hypothetical protein
MGILLGMFKQSNLPPRRATKRLSMQMRFLVSGLDENGSEFKTMAETSIVTGQGGCLILDKDVSEGQNLKLCGNNGKTFFANVRWFGYDPLQNRRYIGFKPWALGPLIQRYQPP